MSGTSSVGNSQVYEAGDQVRPLRKALAMYKVDNYTEE